VLRDVQWMCCFACCRLPLTTLLVQRLPSILRCIWPTSLAIHDTINGESRLPSPPALPLPILSRIILQRLPAYCGYTLRLSFHHASAFSAGAQNQEQKEHFRTARAQGQRTSFPLCLRLPLYGGAAIFNVLGLKNHAHPGRVFCPRRGYFHSRN
jgi:hypothetical protein